MMVGRAFLIMISLIAPVLAFSFSISRANRATLTSRQQSISQGYFPSARSFARKIVLFAGLSSEEESAGRAFYEAASKGNVAKLKALAQEYSGNKNVLNFKIQERYGRTPLVIASYYGKTEAVKFLLGLRGVDPNQGTAYGATPLHFAAHRGHLDVVNVLLADRRVKVNAKATGGKWTGYSILDVCSGMGMAGKPDVIAAIKAKGGKAGKGGGSNFV